jgi:hypothetical protein
MADRGCGHLNTITMVKHAKTRECDESRDPAANDVNLRTPKGE